MEFSLIQPMFKATEHKYSDKASRMRRLHNDLACLERAWQGISQWEPYSHLNVRTWTYNTQRSVDFAFVIDKLFAEGFAKQADSLVKYATAKGVWKPQEPVYEPEVDSPVTSVRQSPQSAQHVGAGVATHHSPVIRSVDASPYIPPLQPTRGVSDPTGYRQPWSSRMMADGTPY